jgi:ADP-ribose pyrophosphatase
MSEKRIQWAKPGGWRLVVDEIRHPNGTLVERALVEHPGSVVLVPLRGRNVIMLRQQRPALKQRILELPAGTRAWDEPWEQCAQRELREETGYRADLLRELGQIWPAPGITDEVMTVFLATGLSPDPLPGDFDEDISLAPMPLDDLVAMALDGRLQDAKSVVGVLRVFHYLQSQMA